MDHTPMFLWSDHSAYVEWRTLDADHVRACWHAVYWPPVAGQDDGVVYEYCDKNFLHAWSVCLDHAYFSDVDEAMQFALLFGGGAHYGSIS